MFTSGFEKTAGIPEAAGKLKGTASRAISSAIKGVKKWRKNVGERATTSYRQAVNPARKPLGSALAKGKSGITAAQAKPKIEARAANINKIREGNKKSFASKHPFLTAGGLYLGARAAFGGDDGEKKQTPAPQVYAPQY